MSLSIKHVGGNTYEISCSGTTVQVQLGNNPSPGGGASSGGQGTFPGGATGGGSGGSGGTVTGAGGGAPTGLGDLTPGGVATFSTTRSGPNGDVIRSEIAIAASKIEHVTSALRNVEQNKRLIPTEGPKPDLVLHWLGSEVLDVDKVRRTINDVLGDPEPKLRVLIWSATKAQ